MYEDDMRCRSCMEDGSVEDETHVFGECRTFHDKPVTEGGIKFEYIFGTLDQQINAINHFVPIMTKRDIQLEVQETR